MVHNLMTYEELAALPPPPVTELRPAVNLAWDSLVLTWYSMWIVVFVVATLAIIVGFVYGIVYLLKNDAKAGVVE